MENKTSQGRIFLSYRREDSSGYAGRLFDHLKQHFGKNRVFMDISSIEPGVDFVDSIEKALDSCDTFLVLIGKNWLDCRDADGNRRLDDPDDFIRIETSAALRRAVRVFPILVKGAVMPAAKDLPADLAKLARRNAHELSDQRWEFDCNELLAVLESIVGPPDAGSSAPKAADKIIKPAEKEKKNSKAIIGLVISILLVFTQFSEGFADTDSFVGALVLAVIALVLGVVGWYDVKMNKVGGRGLAIASIVCAVLVALLLVEQFSAAPVTNFPAASLPGRSQDTVGKIAPETRVAGVPEPAAVPAAPGYANLSGSWRGSDGMTYMFEQHGYDLQVLGFNPFGVQMMIGRGTLRDSRQSHFTYSLADGSSGEFTLQVIAEGQTMNASYINHSTGQSGRILLNREAATY